MKQYLNYIGSKYSLTPFIDQAIQTIIQQYPDDKTITIGDICAGAGSVSNYLERRYPQVCVVANDIEYYSFCISFASLKCNYTPKLQSLIDNMNNSTRTENEMLVTSNYTPYKTCERMYFTVENGFRIDTIRSKINELYYEKKICFSEYIFLVASLITSADKVANVACIYGAYLKKFKTSALKTLTIEPIHTKTDIQTDKHTVLQQNILNNINQSFDIVYLDPPYNNRQYGANYFILNYIALYGREPAAEDDIGDVKEYTLRGKTGIFDYFKSSFCQKKSVVDSLEAVVKILNTSYIVLSYNSESLITMDQMVKILQKYGSVDVLSKSYKKFKSQKQLENEMIVEYIFVLKKSQ